MLTQLWCRQKFWRNVKILQILKPEMSFQRMAWLKHLLFWVEMMMMNRLSNKTSPVSISLILMSRSKSVHLTSGNAAWWATLTNYISVLSHLHLITLIISRRFSMKRVKIDELHLTIRLECMRLMRFLFLKDIRMWSFVREKICFLLWLNIASMRNFSRFRFVFFLLAILC